MKILRVLGMALASIMVGCDEEESQPLVSLRSDLVPLKVIMTDYVKDGGGEKLLKIECSAQLIVPLANCKPERDGDKFKCLLPQPVVDTTSTKIEKQTLVWNERGFFTSQKADSKRINDLRKEAAKAMQELAGSKDFVDHARRNTEDVLHAFYRKSGYQCSVEWEK